MYCSISTGYKPRATCQFQKPPPRPSSKGREIYFVTNREPQASSRLETTNHKRRNVTTSHKLQATSWFSRFPGRGRPCRPRSGVHAARTAKTLSTPPCPPRVTRCGPSRHLHHELRTTYQAPRSGHTGPPLRRDNTRHESRAATTGHKPRATGRCFVIPAKRAGSDRRSLCRSRVS